MSGSAPSLNRRLLLASALVLPVFLGLTGLALERAFERRQYTAAREYLQSQVYLIFSVAELSNAGERAALGMPDTLLEPAFQRPDSGLYAYIHRPSGERLWRSNSARLSTHSPAPEPPARAGELVLDRARLPAGPHWRARYRVIWEDERGAEHPFDLTLLQSRAPYRAELNAFRRQLWPWLGAAALALLWVQWLLTRWGLRPLGHLARDLRALHRGEQNELAGRYPGELQPVVDNLNRVLVRERGLRRRYRDSLNNLAHSLKTPLAVLRAMIEQHDRPGPKALSEPLERMEQAVRYQLGRAVSDQQGETGRHTAIEPTARRLASSLEKVYRDRAPRIELAFSGEPVFPGEEADLLELLGNLMDNACKYGRGRVRVSGKCEAQHLALSVEDDGPGIAPERRTEVFRRGRRLDSGQPGQGIGLALASDIAASYGGQLSLDDSPLGGIRVRVTLPMETAP